VAVLVALLRGVNVGGRAKVSMADLRAVATDLGYDGVRTYIQSGNLLCTTTTKADRVARDLERAIAERCGVETDVIVRTRAQLAKVVDRSPFLPRGEDPKHLHVVFTTGRARVPIADVERYAPEEVQAVGTELHLLLPNGVGRSKLAADLAKAGKGQPGTMRNWNTVTRLLAMADEPA
jgi:uncharacterized protein (DUF1697 family)